MDQSRTRIAALAMAIVVLVLPVLYVGSYLLLVTPGGIDRQRVVREPLISPVGYDAQFTVNYLDH
jgi:hypothetical protein